jgi:hypothetical protein
VCDLYFDFCANLPVGGKRVGATISLDVPNKKNRRGLA